MAYEHWRERAALKAASRERVRALSALTFHEYALEAERAAEEARRFLAAHAAAVREGRFPSTRTGFARLYREANAIVENLAAASFVLDEEDPFHLFGATTDRVRRAFPFLSDDEARRYVIRKLHDFGAPTDPDLPLRGALSGALFQASLDYRAIVTLKLRTLSEPLQALQGILDILARYAPVYAGVPDAEVPAFQALPLERRLKMLETGSSLGRRPT